MLGGVPMLPTNLISMRYRFGNSVTATAPLEKLSATFWIMATVVTPAPRSLERMRLRRNSVSFSSSTAMPSVSSQYFRPQVAVSSWS